MRDFEERKAEIFRRSERRIAQRRRRNRVIISCIPLVISIAVLSFIKLPFITPVKHGANEPSEQVVMDTAAPTENSLNAAHRSVVKIQGNGAEGYYSKVIEDPETVKSITNVIESIDCETDSSFKDGEAPNGSASQGGAVSGSQLPEDNKGSMSYTITVIFPDGSESSYTVADKRFTNLESGTQVLLTEKQLEKIMSLLFDSQ